MVNFNPRDFIKKKEEKKEISQESKKKNLAEVREKVLRIIKSKGAVLPVEISKEIELNTMFSGAILSELVTSGKIKISHAKVGGSPLYYSPQYKSKLSRLYEYLNEKDQRAYNLLKEKGILNDDDLTPLMSVAMRQIKDFAIPIDVTFKKENGEEETLSLWKWYILDDKIINREVSDIIDKYKKENKGQESEDEENEDSKDQNQTSKEIKKEIDEEDKKVEQEIEKRYSSEKSEEKTKDKKDKEEEKREEKEVEKTEEKEPKKEEKEKEEKSEEKPEKQKETKEEKTENKEEPKEEKKEDKPAEKPPEDKKEEKTEKKEKPKKKETKTKSKKSNSKETDQKTLNVLDEEEKDELKARSDFLKEIIYYFENNNIEILEADVVRKNTEADFIVRIPSIIGRIEYFCKAKGKKKVNDKDVSAVYIEAQSKKLPVLLLITGNCTKKAKKLVKEDLKNIIIKRI